MTLLSQILSLFPAFVMAIAAGCFLWLLIAPSIFSILALVFTLYILPLLIYRIHQRFYPIKFGISYLIGEKYSPWWGSQQIQIFYSTFPVLERILILIPGLFSVWLRLWGAKIGHQVYWTPSVEIIDRGLIEVGDRTVFGHKALACSHVIKPKRNNLMLYVQKIEIGHDVFVGAGVQFSAGAKVTDGAYIPFGTLVYVGKEFTGDKQDKGQEET